ncbi:hypothetical protein DITRI_Ditri17bG0070100 [Diplodiscus trichospermus]
MSHDRRKQHGKHPRVSWGNTSYDNQVYATTMDPMPHQSYRTREYPNSTVDFTFNKNDEEQRILDAMRAQMTECEYGPQPVKTTENNQVKEDVNKEAEDYIKLEHKKFARLNTWMYG